MPSPCTRAAAAKGDCIQHCTQPSCALTWLASASLLGSPRSDDRVGRVDGASLKLARRGGHRRQLHRQEQQQQRCGRCRAGHAAHSEEWVSSVRAEEAQASMEGNEPQPSWDSGSGCAGGGSWRQKPVQLLGGASSCDQDGEPAAPRGGGPAARSARAAAEGIPGGWPGRDAQTAQLYQRCKRLQQPRCALLRPSPHVDMGSLPGHKTSNSRWCSAPDGDRSPSSTPPRCDPPPAA